MAHRRYDQNRNQRDATFRQPYDDQSDFNDSPRRGRPGYDNRNQRFDREFGSSHQDFNRFSETTNSYAGKGPKGWSRLDERIREDVCEALERDSYVDASEIDVAVENGVVTLSGTVNERRAKRMAEDCVEDVSGVRDVQNQLRVASDVSTARH